MEPKGVKVAVLAEEMYNEFELWYPYYRLRYYHLREAGVETVLVDSGNSSLYHSKYGLPVAVYAAGSAPRLALAGGLEEILQGQG